MKVTYNFDCHCCFENSEIDVPDNATSEEIELAIFDDILSRYADDFSWRKESNSDSCQ